MATEVANKIIVSEYNNKASKRHELLLPDTLAGGASGLVGAVGNK